jgi:hypothetical protein
MRQIYFEYKESATCKDLEINCYVIENNNKVLLRYFNEVISISETKVAVRVNLAAYNLYNRFSAWTASELHPLIHTIATLE